MKIVVELTADELRYLLVLVRAEEAFEEDSRHVPYNESAERMAVAERLLTAAQKAKLLEEA